MVGQEYLDAGPFAC